MSAALTNYERWERELQDDKMRGKAKPAEPMDAQERARRWWGANIPGSMIKATAVLISQAEQDERRKVLDQVITYCQENCEPALSRDNKQFQEVAIFCRALAEEAT